MCFQEINIFKILKILSVQKSAKLWKKSRIQSVLETNKRWKSWSRTSWKFQKFWIFEKWYVVKFCWNQCVLFQCISQDVQNTKSCRKFWNFGQEFWKNQQLQKENKGTYIFIYLVSFLCFFVFLSFYLYIFLLSKKLYFCVFWLCKFKF